MKRNLVFMLMMTLLPALATAQNLTLRPHAGLTSSWFASDEIVASADEILEPKHLYGWVVGAELEYRSNRIFGASVALDYSTEGTRYEDGNTLKDYRFRQHRLSLPVLAVCHIGTTGLALEAGLRPSYLLSATNGYTDPTGEHSDDATSLFRRVTFDIPVGLSYSYGALKATLRYNIGLGHQYDFEGDGDSATARSIWLTLGYGFSI